MELVLPSHFSSYRLSSLFEGDTCWLFRRFSEPQFKFSFSHITRIGTMTKTKKWLNCTRICGQKWLVRGLQQRQRYAVTTSKQKILMKWRNISKGTQARIRDLSTPTTHSLILLASLIGVVLISLSIWWITSHEIVHTPKWLATVKHSPPIYVPFWLARRISSHTIQSTDSSITTSHTCFYTTAVCTSRKKERAWREELHGSVQNTPT